MEAINKNMKKEMVDFVSFYRRFNNVSGKQSFSTLYTAINGNTRALYHDGFVSVFPFVFLSRSCPVSLLPCGEFTKGLRKSALGRG